MTTTKTVYLSNPSVTNWWRGRHSEHQRGQPRKSALIQPRVNDVRRYRAPLRVGAPNGERHLDNVPELRRRRN
jgi:hypothetical protein